MSQEVVCVTGASGYIASELVRQLLQKGYYVKGTVRDLGDQRKTQHLKNLEGANERLELKQANLLEPGSFKDAVNGTSCVYHTASPFFLETDNPEKDLLQPAIDGTKNVLNTCAEESSIKRVVLTSSMAAVAFSENDPNYVYTEKDFSDEEYMQKNGLHYVLSKTRAEKAAWDFVEEKKPHFDLVAVNPCLVIGPMVQPSLNTSSERLLQYLNGSKGKISDSYAPLVDVRDVAKGHITAAEKPQAHGRYLMNPYVEHWSKIVNILKGMDLPEVDKSKIPSQVEKSEMKAYPRMTDSSKAEKDLNLEWTPLEDSLRDHVKGLKEHGYL